MERRETQFISKSEKELGHVADLLLHEYLSEDDFFNLLDELKKEAPSEEVMEHFTNWSRADRIALQDTLFWKLDPKLQKKYQQRLKRK